MTTSHYVNALTPGVLGQIQRLKDDKTVSMYALKFQDLLDSFKRESSFGLLPQVIQTRLLNEIHTLFSATFPLPSVTTEAETTQVQASAPPPKPFIDPARVQTLIRMHNASSAKVLACLSTQSPKTRREIMADTGLRATTVKDALKILRMGRLVESGTKTVNGRPTYILAFGQGSPAVTEASYPLPTEIERKVLRLFWEVGKELHFWDLKKILDMPDAPLEGLLLAMKQAGLLLRKQGWYSLTDRGQEERIRTYSYSMA